ncbi:MAG: hypothetical protein U0800_09195 [Isosphaeraceae bacterium]
MKIWTVEAADIERLQSRDQEFADLVNDLLLRHTKNGGVPQGYLRLNLNTRAPDGGADAAVDQPNSGSEAGDYCEVLTCWQYKACKSGHVSPPTGMTGGQKVALEIEINKKEAKRLTEAGYGFRFCIADELTPDLIAKWERWLKDAALEINPNAPAPKVLTASRLAAWINSYPGLIRRLRNDLGPFRDLKTWGSEIKYLTERYHPVSDWDGHIRTIREFADFSRVPSRAVLSVRGEAGVGKSRCVYEALANDASNRAIVVYTTSETDAEALANQLASNHEAMALIVADECSQAVAIRMDRSLRAHSKRLRIITIDNQQQSEQTSIGELRLSRLTGDDVSKVLEINYPDISADRLRAFASLSEGFVRLAVDLCDNQGLIPSDGSIGGSLTEFFRRQYLTDRLQGDELTAVLLVSLVTRVGFASEVAGHLQHLCQACRESTIAPTRIIEIARRLKQSPGFIALGDRYLYVTPRLIAQAAFRAAWERWVTPDPNAFYAELHPDLVEPFLRQLRDAGTEEMRRDSTDFFMMWISSLSEQDLADEAKVRLLVRLADVEPSSVLPQLRRLIESISIEELKNLHAIAGLDDFDLELIQRSSRAQAARRELVWFAERFLSLPDFFNDAESILFRLALAETESYGNNASGVWKQIFQVALSGTPLPYEDRLQVLEARFNAADDNSIKLLASAADTAISGFQRGRSRVLGPPIVAGRIPPPDWRPSSGEETRSCWTATVELLHRLSEHEKAIVRGSVMELTIDCLKQLVLMGSLVDVQDIVSLSSPLPDLMLSKLLRELDGFLEVFCEPGSKRVDEATVDAIRGWRSALVPATLHGQLVALVGEEPWRRWGKDQNEQKAEFIPIAQQLLSTPNEFKRELPWLLSDEAKSAYELGVRMGELDQDAELLDSLLAAAANSANSAICRGYVKGLLECHPTHIERTGSLLDRYERESPRMVFDVISTGSAALRPLDRLLSMIDQGFLPPIYARGYVYTGAKELSGAELAEILRRLVRAAQGGNKDEARAALDILWIQLRGAAREGRELITTDPALLPFVTTILGLTLEGAGREAHAWSDLVAELAKVDVGQAIHFCTAALSSRDLNLPDFAIQQLNQLASSHPEAVIDSLGNALLDPTTGVYVRMQSIRGVIEKLPFKVILGWLERKGAEAAVAIARHLPEPTFVENRPVVPELTEFVLHRFAGDDRVFREFCAGTFIRSYSGDIAGQIEKEGENARPFLAHPLQSVREWAQYMIERSKEQAAYWRARDEEDGLPQ